VDHSAGLSGGVGSTFLQEQCIRPTLLTTTRKVATYGDCPQEVYAEHMWTGMRSIRVVFVGFSPAGCTSIRIAAILGYK
jgi:hypothetical protein